MNAADAIRVTHPDQLAGETLLRVAESEALAEHHFDVVLSANGRRRLRVRRHDDGALTYEYVSGSYKSPLTRREAVELLSAAVKETEAPS